jgi:hypothetical protein
MVCPFTNRALVVTARALEEENIELSNIGIWRLSVDFRGAGRLLSGADSLDTLSLIISCCLRYNCMVLHAISA